MAMNENVLLIPIKPDPEAQYEVSESTADYERSNSVTCQVEVQCESNSSWKLFSRDSKGTRKGWGGDEFYIRYEEYEQEDNEVDALRLQAVAFISDNSDGSYELDFCTTPTNPNFPSNLDSVNTIRVLTVYFEYSNQIGEIPSPLKSTWKNGGYTHKQYTCTSSCRPRIRTFCPPIDSDTINLRSFHQVYAFGDSTMDQFVRQRPNKKGKYYFQPQLQVGEKMRLPMNSETVSTHLQLLHEQFGEKLTHSTSSSKTALMVGSCLWDILDYQDTLQGNEYEDHISSCRYYVEQIRERYPNVTVVWKSPMAVHIHWVDLERLIEHPDKETAATLFGIDRVRYMSASRSRFLYHRQAQLMKDLDVPLLNLYEATYLSADQLYPSDGRHYRPILNRMMLQWFYRH
eukprot:scaffold1525_cov142-Cylindrotheca_fusiformis.AAC.155